MILAAVGDIVQFQFSSGNHTVTESAENEGCTPLQKKDPKAIHSGHIPFEAGQTTVGTFNMPVTRKGPMFLYCATGPHCQTGQVMMINPSTPQQLAQYAMVSGQAKENIDGIQLSGGTVNQIEKAASLIVEKPPEEDEKGPEKSPKKGAEMSPEDTTNAGKDTRMVEGG
ncbi:extracellular serine-rich protein [Hirsutella rhossiliensis]|uniref:Extracellular serine-rich protein n=1 Tax=Hirsutella rhossiliensis TaxID=111463 RepID=A0A9P8SDR1_9HYPO|nr:extracellular serine-rich protein [Hirsutella rhossiliensis]KAH0957605.1 extracellular serine-rich protein [Hirsutella rhossiliensis]